MKILIKKIRRKFLEFQRFKSEVRFYNGKESVIYIRLNNRTKVRTYLNLIFHLRNYYSKPIVLHFSPFSFFILAKWFSKIDTIYFSKPFSKPLIFRTFSHNKDSDFKIDYHYQKVYNSQELVPNVIPYIMHPQNYQSETLISDEKYIGVILSGNFEKNIYDTPTLTEKFGVLNRSVIHDEIIKLESCVLISGSELSKNLASKIYLEKLILMKWQSGAISSEKWRYYLSTAKFIFCAPGMTMPLCHNVIEALSVGTVPILNYANWLNPSLVEGVNCFFYSDINSIGTVVKKALAIDKEQYKIIRDNCIDYYEKYYAGFDFEKFKGQNLTMINENKEDLPRIK